MKQDAAPVSRQEKDGLTVRRPLWTARPAVLPCSQLLPRSALRINHPDVRVFRNAVNRRHVAPGRCVGYPSTVRRPLRVVLAAARACNWPHLPVHIHGEDVGVVDGIRVLLVIG